MKPIRYFLFILLCSLVGTGCKKDIDWLDFSDQNQLCINAVLSDYKSVNIIYCYQIQNNRFQIVKDVVIDLYVNGQHAETITHSQQDNHHYVSRIKFQPGDVVRLEARSEQCQASAWAEETVPMPVEIVSIDTATVSTKFADYYQAEDYYHVHLGLHQPSTRPDFYRILSGLGFKYSYGYYLVDNLTDDILAEGDTVIYVSSSKVKFKDDIALTDGKGYEPNEDHDVLGLNITYKNHYCIFSGSYFNAGNYMLSYYIDNKINKTEPLWANTNFTYKSKDSWLYGRKFHTKYHSQYTSLLYYLKERESFLNYRVLSLSQNEYHYLKGLSAQKDIDDQEPPFLEPVILPQNIHGALGLFTLQSSTTGAFPIPESELEEKSSWY